MASSSDIIMAAGSAVLSRGWFRVEALQRAVRCGGVLAGLDSCLRREKVGACPLARCMSLPKLLTT